MNDSNFDDLLAFWKEKTGFSFMRTLEDNQLLSPPFFTQSNGSCFLFGFVFTYNANESSISISQHHLWDTNQHMMFFCDKKYSGIKLADVNSFCSRDYINRSVDYLELIKTFVFKNNLSSNEIEVISEYKAFILSCGNMGVAALKENSPYEKWANSFLQGK